MTVDSAIGTCAKTTEGVVSCERVLANPRVIASHWPVLPYALEGLSVVPASLSTSRHTLRLFHRADALSIPVPTCSVLSAAQQDLSRPSKYLDVCTLCAAVPPVAL